MSGMLKWLSVCFDPSVIMSKILAYQKKAIVKLCMEAALVTTISIENKSVHLWTESVLADNYNKVKVPSNILDCNMSLSNVLPTNTAVMQWFYVNTLCFHRSKTFFTYMHVMCCFLCAWSGANTQRVCCPRLHRQMSWKWCILFLENQFLNLWVRIPYRVMLIKTFHIYIIWI